MSVSKACIDVPPCGYNDVETYDAFLCKPDGIDVGDGFDATSRLTEYVVVRRGDSRLGLLCTIISI